ncbi:MAG: PRTRC system ThiF family protein [Desulfuromonadaceae bacterium]|nr:PRTRC system ThiF family protein [Desulfuromonadaceae bacterium]
MMYHYTKPQILNPYDPVEVLLIGCGGTGSQVLTGLARINAAILGLGHGTGLRVTVLDPDTVSESNIGRQLFSPADVGCSKGRVLVERINRFYGGHWMSYAEYFSPAVWEYIQRPDFVISAVDNVACRRLISEELEKMTDSCYWLDLGNSENSGQVVLGMNPGVTQPEGGVPTLPNIFHFFPNLEDSEDANAPSCSMAEALEHQDLFINQAVAVFGLDLIWKMFRYGRIENHGAFIALQDYRTVPITVESSCHRFELLAE